MFNIFKRKQKETGIIENSMLGRIKHEKLLTEIPTKLIEEEVKKRTLLYQQNLLIESYSVELEAELDRRKQEASAKPPEGN